MWRAYGAALCVALVLAVVAAAQTARTVDLATVSADFQVWGKQAASADYGLGCAVAAGDVNGDGITDLIVGNPDQIVGGLSRAGEVYVFFGKASRGRETVDLLSRAANVTLGGLASGAQFGRALTTGDVNGDGMADLIVGQPFLQRPGIVDAGAVYVFYGTNAWPTSLNTAAADVAVLGAKYNGRFGIAVAAGDVNADGAADLLVGASEVDFGGTRSRVGEAYAIFMSKSFPARHLIDTGITPPDVAIIGRDYADRLGLSVASGDPNGDGIDDMLVGSPMARPDGRANAGEIYAIWGRKSWPLPYRIDLASPTGPQPDLLVKGRSLYDRMSWTIRCGDLDGDGVDDMLSGAHRADPWNPTRAEGGKAFVFFGRKDFPPNHVIDLATATPDVAVFGRAADDQLGFAVAIGDFDHDGRSDLLASASRADFNGRTDCGAVYVFRGPFSAPSTFDLAVAVPHAEIYGPTSDAYVGNGAVALTDEYNGALALGDFNADGVTDVILGAPRLSPAGRVHAGGAFVVHGGFSYWLDPPRVNTTPRIQLRAPAFPGTYRLGAAAFGGERGIPIDSRRFPLNVDALFFFSLAAPAVFRDYAGLLDSRGEAVACIAIPNEPGLVGITLYTAFALLDTQAPSGAAALGNRLPITFEP
ncbi:MAG: FG-GAP repeat protein [Planctomycetes bacterium]|nr:FG-GAP repeat protein [Planctomycetota bacterium]